MYGSRKIGFLLGLIYGVCSFVWPYNTSLWPQPLQALTLIASAFFIYKSYAIHHQLSFICHYTRPDNKKDSGSSRGIYYAGLGGLFLGLSILAQPTSLVLIPGFIAFSIFSMRHHKKALVSFLIALVITSFFVGLLNYVRFGSFTSFGYGYYSSLPLIMGGEV